MKPGVAIKANGKIQRADVGLTKEVAGALVQRVFDGKNLFPPEGYIEIAPEGGEAIKLSCMTIKSWITREAMIPETGFSLRSILDKAREDYRTRKREELQKKMVADAESVLNRTMNIRTNLPVRTMFGSLVKNEDGSLVRKENHNLLRVKVDAAKYVTERLDPARYGKVEKSENKHLVFSLSDLRKAKTEMEKE